MNAHEPIARIVAKHRVIRTLVIYRIFFLGYFSLILVMCIKHHWLSRQSFLGILGYDWLIHLQFQHFGTELIKFGGYVFWLQFGFFACIFIGCNIALALLNQNHQNKRSILHASLLAIPYSLLFMSMICSTLGLVGNDLWQQLAQINHAAPLVHRGIIVSHSNPTYPLLILFLFYLFMTVGLYRKKPKDCAWITDICRTLKLLTISSPLLFVYCIICMIISDFSSNAFFQDTSFHTALILLLLGLFWCLLFLTFSMLLLPAGASAKRILTQVRYVGYGLFYPMGFSTFLVCLAPLFIVIMPYCLTLLQRQIEYGYFESYTHFRELPLRWFALSIPCLILQYNAIIKFLAKLKPRTLLICQSCRYDLTGTLLASHRHCPECGRPISGNYRLRKLAAQNQQDKVS